MTRHLHIALDGSFTDEAPPSLHADRWVKARPGGHWANEGHPGWFAWRGAPGYYARRRLSSPPQVVGPADVLGDLSLMIEAYEHP